MCIYSLCLANTIKRQLQNLPCSEDRFHLTGTTGVSPVDILNGQDARSPSMEVLQLLLNRKNTR